MKRICILWILIPMTWACEKENQSYTDPAFDTYINKFQQEALVRNITIDLSMVTIIFVSDLDRFTKGQCNQYESGRKEIRLSADYWTSATAAQREVLLFHELGHCVLDRAHQDDVQADGSCMSIMRSNGDLCTLTYNANTSPYYLDELFLSR